MDCLRDWGKFMRLCIPGMLMLCMEWWGFEIGVFLTGIKQLPLSKARVVNFVKNNVWYKHYNEVLIKK